MWRCGGGGRPSRGWQGAWARLPWGEGGREAVTGGQSWGAPGAGKTRGSRVCGGLLLLWVLQVILYP